MFRYANYQICLLMNINEYIRNKRKIIKKLRGVHTKLSTSQLFTFLYTTRLGTNLMLINSMFTL